MASYTTNLNLELPTVNERYDILKVNSNMEKIDDGYGVLNDQIANLITTDTFNFELSSSQYVGKYYYDKSMDTRNIISIEIVSSTSNIPITVQITNKSQSGNIRVYGDTASATGTVLVVKLNT